MSVDRVIWKTVIWKLSSLIKHIKQNEGTVASNSSITYNRLGLSLTYLSYCIDIASVGSTIKAYFPLGDFVRATRSENKNTAT